MYVLVEGRACQSAWKGCEQMIAEPVYPHIVVECRDSSEAIEFWAKDVSVLFCPKPILQLCHAQMFTGLSWALGPMHWCILIPLRGVPGVV